MLGLAILLFASTNMDDIFILLGFFADPEFRFEEIVAGQYAGIIILFGVSVVGSLLTLVIPRAFIGLLGVFAIGLGATKLLDIARHHAEIKSKPTSHDTKSRRARTLTVAIVTLGNGADNLGVYTPAFAVRSGHQIALFGLVFTLMTAVWCFFAYWLVNRPTLGMPIRRYGRRVAPLILIAIGVLVMHEAGSFALLFHHAR
jgi:cadmium resistance protein CadD (predicted permease)